MKKSKSKKSLGANINMLIGVIDSYFIKVN